jgi:nitrate reductase NapD
MDIASAVVHAIPGRRDEVRSALQRLQGVEIHAETPDGRFIVTVEDLPDVSAADTVVGLHRLDGVLAAAMVYQYSDQAIDTKEDRHDDHPT